MVLAKLQKMAISPNFKIWVLLIVSFLSRPSWTNLKGSTIDKYKVSGRPGLPIFRLLQDPPQNWPFLTIFPLL